jgi:hypothetical protein
MRTREQGIKAGPSQGTFVIAKDFQDCALGRDVVLDAGDLAFEMLAFHRNALVITLADMTVPEPRSSEVGASRSNQKE